MERIQTFMKAHTTLKQSIKSVMLGAAVVLGAGAACAQDNAGTCESVCHKPGTFNVYPFGQFLFGGHINEAIGLGVGVGYNLCEQGSVTFEGYVGDLDTRINGYHGVGTTYNATLNFEYKLRKGARFSPYLTLGAGMFNYDSKDYDPHYINLNVSGSGVMGGGGAGVSYEFCERSFMKLCFRVWGTSVHNADVLYGPTLAVAYSF